MQTLSEQFKEIYEMTCALEEEAKKLSQSSIDVIATATEVKRLIEGAYKLVEKDDKE